MPGYLRVGRISWHFWRYPYAGLQSSSRKDWSSASGARERSLRSAMHLANPFAGYTKLFTDLLQSHAPAAETVATLDNVALAFGEHFEKVTYRALECTLHEQLLRLSLHLVSKKFAQRAAATVLLTEPTATS